MAVYNLKGERIAINEYPDEKKLNYDACVLSVNHRGYSTVAPENTLPAYILSKKMGFNYAETDISFTSDGIPVLLHDSTIDRTSNGTGNITQMTFAQARQYDFGSWKSPEYAETKIPSLAEFLSLCKSIMLHPYLELKSNGAYTQAQIEQIVGMVNDYGLRGKVTYISFTANYLQYVKNADDKARLGYLRDVWNTADVATCQNLQTEKNEVFYDVNYGIITSAMLTAMKNAKIPMEAWTVNTSTALLRLDKYISGITSDSLIAGKVLYDNAMAEN